MGELMTHDREFYECPHVGSWHRRFVVEALSSQAIDHHRRIPIAPCLSTALGQIVQETRHGVVEFHSVFAGRIAGGIDDVIDGCPLVVVAVASQDILIEVVDLHHPPMGIHQGRPSFLVGNGSLYAIGIDVGYTTRIGHEEGF